MPISITDLKGNIRTINVSYFQFNSVVKYRPAMMTPVSDSEIQDAIDNGDREASIRRLCEILVDWDLIDEDGEMYPITPDALGGLDSGFLTAILQAVNEDRVPKPKSARGSFAR